MGPISSAELTQAKKAFRGPLSESWDAERVFHKIRILSPSAAPVSPSHFGICSFHCEGNFAGFKSGFGRESHSQSGKIFFVWNAGRGAGGGL